MKKLVVAMGILFAGIAMVPPSAAAGKPTRGLDVVLREYSQSMTLAPGEVGSVTSVCAPGETVLSGSATTRPTEVTLVWSSLVYDGTNSGWMVEYQNNGAETVNVYAATGALCTAGTLTPG